jgi:uncharacterized damage-inducible protein DinB
MKRWLSAGTVVLLLAVLSLQSPAQEMTGFKADLMGQIKYASQELTQLENAMPQETMTWRPMEGVRSVSEVYLHVAFTNYLFMNMVGVKPPSDIDLKMPNEGAEWEKSTTDKKEVAERLAKSFEFVENSLKNFPEDKLDDPVTLFGQKTTMRGVWLVELSHINQHLGQSIAYARTNKIVPPWTAAQMAKAKEKKEKKD